MTTLIIAALAFGAGYITAHPTLTWRGIWDTIRGWFTRERH